MYEFITTTRKRETRNFLRIDVVRWCERRIPLSRGPHVTGRVSPGTGCPSVAFESLNEKGAIEGLLAVPGVLLVLSQPFTVHYRWKGRRRRYTPDLLVVAQPVPASLRRRGFGPLTVVEVKPLADADDSDLVDLRLHVAQLATGMPALLAFPTAASPAGGGK